MKEQLAAGLGEGQIAELVEHDEIEPCEMVCDAALPAGTRLGLDRCMPAPAPVQRQLGKHRGQCISGGAGVDCEQCQVRQTGAVEGARSARIHAGERSGSPEAPGLLEIVPGGAAQRPRGDPRARLSRAHRLRWPRGKMDHGHGPALARARPQNTRGELSKICRRHAHSEAARGRQSSDRRPGDQALAAPCHGASLPDPEPPGPRSCDDGCGRSGRRADRGGVERRNGRHLSQMSRPPAT